MVNVLDYGAVGDGVQDCSAAFQAAVDDLRPKPGTENLMGGTILVPATKDWYQFERSVIVDVANVRFVGDGPETTVLESRKEIPPLVFGLLRGTRAAPLSVAHWADLAGVLDPAAGQRWGYRTGGPDATATVTFPCSPFSLGPRVGYAGWAGLEQFTLDFVVKNNSGDPWGKTKVPLFGLVDEDTRPSPFGVWLTDDHPEAPVRFGFTTDDGLYREIGVPLADAAEPVLRCSLQLDFTTGEVAAWAGRVQVSPDVDLLNVRWAGPGANVRFAGNHYASFNLGVLTSLADGQSAAIDRYDFPATPDLTFAALRVSSVAQYRNLAAGTPQQTKTAAVTDLDWLNPGPGVFGVLPMNEGPTTDQALDGAVPDLQVPWMSDAARTGHGLFQVNPPGPTDATAANGLEKLTVNCGRTVAEPGNSNYGQCVAVGHSFGLELRDCLLQYGAQGLSSLNIVNTYPVRIDSCRFDAQSDASIYAYALMAYGRDLKFSSPGRHAVKAVNTTIALRDVFCEPSFAGDDCETVVRLINSSGEFDNWTFDFEYTTNPVGSYFHASIGKEVIGRNLALAIRDVQAGTAGPEAVGVRLVSGDSAGGLATVLRGPSWCSIERSFTSTTSAGLAAIAAVDGPLWQGTFTGPAPVRPELVRTDASPGASARIGAGFVPPARTVPRPPGPDPIRSLPGLLGYYQADSVTVPGSGGKPVAPADGTPITVLTDLGPRGNHGQLHGNPAIHETDAVNGRAALRFTGGWYTFPAMRGSGAVTLFLVQRGYPVIDTAPVGEGTLRQFGGFWQVGRKIAARAASSTTDWALYTARYEPESGVFDLWANGRRYDTRRHPTAGNAVIDQATLGASGNGGQTFPGTFAAAAVIGGALPDDQVDLVHRYLLNQHAIPV
ncbi:Pectate lyase superfamily protein [Amycolatopsis australiensis]|uniref:Pectate lyase superfamily protein n=1 Tax=Amycolatopsis australiensis TaxID=546364 RepID=A0A1K1SWW0_9PSEU|nr:Pectate lyase superfamily protein [Amycolatopsis australiensis]